MTILTLREATIRVAGRTLLAGADFTLEAGRRVGLVGRNGAGKSTLLKAIAGELSLDGGTLALSPRVRLGRVAQESLSGEASVLDTVLAADVERARLLAEAETAPPERLGEIHDRLRAIGADAAPARAAATLAGLGFDTHAQARPIGSFSGGWRMRAALATALFLEPDLLLLDEPTNHLDLEATLWLEGWLARFPGAAIIVSHDRALLDSAVHAIAHLERGKITVTPGGFTEFVRLRTERAERQAAEAARISARRAELQAFVDRFRAKASKARQAQSRLKAIARLPVIEAVVEEAPAHFSFPEPEPLPPPILAADRAAVGYGARPVLENLSFRIDQDDRIALLGRNGNGKSTLAKLLAGRLAPLKGSLFRAPKLKVGHFAQSQEEELALSETPIDHMARALPRATTQEVRAQLARFGLDADRAGTKVGALSGGEKARLLLALATRDSPGLLILDEPTNHLDIDAREALVRALAAYSGAVVLISHDPHLIELVADRLWLVANGTVSPFEGDLDDYRALLAERSRPQAGAQRGGARAEDRRARAEARAALAPLRRQVAEAERVITELAAERAALEARLADPRLYEGGGQAAEIARANARLAAIARETAAAEEAWLEAQAALEAAE